MKKIAIILITSLLFAACGIYKPLDVNKLTTGMTKAQVESVIGLPQRVLAVNDTRDGFQEVLEYRTAYDEVYALEFWDDYLTGYEFLYDDVNYVPSLIPPVGIPDYGRPIIVIPGHNKPNRPNRPSSSERPGNSNRPNSSNRPGSTESPNNTSRPGTSRPGSSRPEVSSPSNNRPSTSRPTESARPSSRPSSSNSGTDRSGMAK